MPETAEISKVAPILFRMVVGHVVSQTVYAAAELGIADHLVNEALTAEELAERCSSHPDAMGRLLRALAAFEIVKCEDRRFSLSPMGGLLRSDVPGSLRAVIRFMIDPCFGRVLENLTHSVRTAQPAFDHVWGMSNFDYYAQHPDFSKIHDEAMAALTGMETAPILSAYDFARFHKIVDVGGGSGAFAAALLQRYPHLAAKLADLPHVIALAADLLQRAGVAARCEVAECDFFESVPAGGDAYLLKSIIHDWDDERALRILKSCNRAMGAGATLLVFERVLPNQPSALAAPRYLADIMMLLVTPGGRERTEKEFGRLLNSAGFELLRVIATGGPLDVLEARKR